MSKQEKKREKIYHLLNGEIKSKVFTVYKAKKIFFFYRKVFF